MWKYVSDIHRVKYDKIRASSDLYFPIHDSVLIRENKNMILLYTEKHRPEKANIAIFYAVIR